MCMNKNKTAAPPETWLCPHCFRREPYDRYLIDTGIRIPLTEDRIQYWHRRKIGETLSPEATVCRLIDWRLMGDPVKSAEEPVHVPAVPRLREIVPLFRNRLRRFAHDTGAKSWTERYCVHCHMPVDLEYTPKEHYHVIVSSKQMHDALGRCFWPSDRPDELVFDMPSDAYRRCGSSGRVVTAIRPDMDVGDRGYLEQLAYRDSLEAVGYLVLLELDEDDCGADLALEEIWRVLKDSKMVRSKTAQIVLLLPPGEHDLSKHQMIQYKLQNVFPDSRPVLAESPAQLDQLLEHIRVQLLQKDRSADQLIGPLENVDVSG